MSDNLRVSILGVCVAAVLVTLFWPCGGRSEPAIIQLDPPPNPMDQLKGDR